MQLCVVHHSPHPVTPLFELLADPRRRPEWQASLDRVELLDEGAPRVGMRWRERPGGLVRFEMAIDRYEADRVWSESLRSSAATGSVFLRFTPEGVGTRVEVEVDLRLAWPWTLGAPLARRFLAREMRRDLRRADACLGTTPT